MILVQVRYNEKLINSPTLSSILDNLHREIDKVIGAMFAISHVPMLQIGEVSIEFKSLGEYAKTPYLLQVLITVDHIEQYLPDLKLRLEKAHAIITEIAGTKKPILIHASGNVSAIHYSSEL